MKFRRIGAVLMAAVLAMAVLAGCGGGSSASGSSDAKTEESAGGGSKVTLWATGSDNVRQIFEKLVADFNSNSVDAGKYTV